ncbi:MAG: radical SAM protein [Actinomycetota bacterium]
MTPDTEILPPATAGWEIRRRTFGDSFDFFAPGLKRYQTSEFTPANARTMLPISVTGSACALQCDHCQAKVLEGMISVKADENLYELASRLRKRGTTSLLVSGGSMRGGGVPLLAHTHDIARIKAELGMRVICHVGYPTAEVAGALAEAGIDAAMMDIIGADDTLRDVYHLDLTVDDVERSLAGVAATGIRVIPHIVIGLHYGRFLGEEAALRMIARYPVWTLVLVVLTPLVGTPMADLPPPPLDEVVPFMAHARDVMPETRLHLGCARPLGGMKVSLDRAAIDHGFNGMAYPAEGTVAYAEARGLEPRFFDTCCSVTWGFDA